MGVGEGAVGPGLSSAPGAGSGTVSDVTSTGGTVKVTGGTGPTVNVDLAFTGAGQLMVGTGAATGHPIAAGATGTVLTGNGAGDPVFGYPPLTLVAGNLATDYSVTGALATFLTTSVLAAGTWLVHFNGIANLSASAALEIEALVGTATATLTGCIATEVTSVSAVGGDFLSVGLTFKVVVTVAGTLIFQAKQTTAAVTIQAETPTSDLAPATGYTALRAA